MTILADREISLFMKRGWLVIDPFEPSNITPNGYDLSISMVRVQDRPDITEGKVIVPAQTWFAVASKETVGLRHRVTGQMWLRSSYARRGILSTFGKVDAGFEGNLTFSAFNASNKDVEIPVGDRFVQIVFEELTSQPEKLYKDRSGNFQFQTGITLEGRKE